MNCIIENTDFYTLEAMKYFSPSTTWSQEKKKENAMNKIFSGEWIGSQKRDGIFCMCGKNPEGEIFVRPRNKNTKGEFVNKVEWIPQIHDFLNEIDAGTVFLGEIYLPRDEQARSSTALMNCLLPKSLKRQEKEEDKLHLYIFDVLAENNKSYLDMCAEERVDLLNGFSRAYPSSYVDWAQYYDGKELWQHLQDLLADGYEGIVILNKGSVYHPGKRSNKVSLKIKKELQDTIDCIIIGANPPTQQYSGKEIETWEYWFDDYNNRKITASEYLAENHETIYKTYINGGAVIPVTKNWFNGWAGSLKLGAYKDNKMVQIGNLSGITDGMKENWRDYIGKVCEVSAMEIMESDTGYGLRHPKLISVRNDIEEHECTWERIFQ